MMAARKATAGQTIELGDLARDPITKFEGVVVGITTWMNGCARPILQPQRLQADGSPVLSQSFDLTQLQLVKKAAVDHLVVETGGPRETPNRI
jgi:hypothetical protein